MSDELYMIELRPNLTSLVRFLEGQGINRKQDEDLGYGVHAWLAAAFGERSPKPYRLLLDHKQKKPPRLLGYGKYGKEELVAQMTDYAQPSVFSVCPPELITAKPMPNKWEASRKIRFEVLTCPVSRKDNVEKDVFLRKADREGTAKGLQREAVYTQWLARELQGAVEITESKLAAFRMVHFYRRGETNRPAKHLRPQALLTGIFRIVDGTAFGKAIERGVGRHRAFGYGMILLRPI